MNNKLFSVTLLCFSYFLGCVSYYSLYAQTTDELYAESENLFKALCSESKVDSTVKNALYEPRLNTQARTALEAIGSEEAVDCLRNALQASDPICVAGCLDSLGRLKDLDSEELACKLALDDDNSSMVRCAALKFLGCIATPKACDVLLNGLNDSDRDIRLACADGLFSAGIQLKDAALFRAVRNASIDSSTTKIAIQNEILLSKDVKLLFDLLCSKEAIDFKAACFVLASYDDWSTEFCEALNNLLKSASSETGNRIIVALGSCGNTAVVQTLVDTLEDEASRLSKVNIIKALGNYDNALVFNACFKFLAAEDEQLRITSFETICKQNSLTDQDVLLIKGVLESYVGTEEYKRLLLNCLNIVAKKELVSLLENVEKIANGCDDGNIAAVSMKVIATIIQPSADSIEGFIQKFGIREEENKETFDSCLEILCRRTNEKSETISVLAKQYSQEPAFLARLVGEMGGKCAADYLGHLALAKLEDSSEEAIETLDEVTKALGRWTSPDAGEALARLALLLPEGRLSKFKTRAIRGYIRIVRQMGEAPLQKVQRIANAYRMTENRPQERALLEGTLDTSFTSNFSEKSLFNGKDLSGWEEYEPGVFRVEDGTIVGGNFISGVSHNHFLTSVHDYRNFYLRLECKILVGDQNQNNDGNAGVQFRSVRIPDNWEMIGYQADMTSDGSYWGCLYDESRRNRMLQVPDAAIQNSILHPNDWNTYEILAQEGNIKIYLNGIQTVDYTEDEVVPFEGKIGLQIHAGGPACAYYRNIFICDSDTNDSK